MFLLLAFGNIQKNEYRCLKWNLNFGQESHGVLNEETPSLIVSILTSFLIAERLYMAMLIYAISNHLRKQTTSHKRSPINNWNSKLVSGSNLYTLLHPY